MPLSDNNTSTNPLIATRPVHKDTIRFCIGPWKGFYSETWRIWASKNSDDVYLSARTIASILKVSLHDSGKCRVALTEKYMKTQKSLGRRIHGDRVFMKWERGRLDERNLINLFEVNYPLTALSLQNPQSVKRGQRHLMVCPDKNTLGDRDSVTMSILYHRLKPNEHRFDRSLTDLGFEQFYSIDLKNDEYLSVCFRYQKLMPLRFTDSALEAQKSLIFRMPYVKSLEIGETTKEFSFLMAGSDDSDPPFLTSIGGITVSRISDDEYEINHRSTDPNDTHLHRLKL